MHEARLKMKIYAVRTKLGKMVEEKGGGGGGKIVYGKR